MDYGWLASFLFFGLSRALHIQFHRGGAVIVSSKEGNKENGWLGGSKSVGGVRFRGPCRARLDPPSGNKQNELFHAGRAGAIRPFGCSV
jgi:hypothetical protein